MATVKETQQMQEEWKKGQYQGFRSKERLSGLNSVESAVAVAVQRVFEEIIENLAKNPNFTDSGPSEIADAILNGLNQAQLTEESIISHFEAVREKSKKSAVI